MDDKQRLPIPIFERAITDAKTQAQAEDERAIDWLQQLEERIVEAEKAMLRERLAQLNG